ncbi:MAG: hypothetical protein AB8G22_24795 [Saprospiraceae bacterium]
MQKLAYYLHLTIAVMFITIGGLHLFVHYNTLIPSELAELLQPIKIIEFGGETLDIWRNWQGYSFMMGVSFIVIGGLNLVVLKQNQDFPPIGLTIIMILLLTTVVYSGIHFFTVVQLYGGLMGIAFLLVALIARMRA